MRASRWAVAVVWCFCVAVFCGVAVAPAAAQAPEPNQGAHVQLTGSYGSATVTGLTVPVSNRWAINLVNAFATNQDPRGGSLGGESLGPSPEAGAGAGLSFHTVELEYARKLSDLFPRAQSSQFNAQRFYFAVSGGAGAVRNAAGAGNSSFAFSFGGRLTLRLNANTAIDVVNVRYWRSRVGDIGGESNAGTQASAGFRFSF